MSFSTSSLPVLHHQHKSPKTNFTKKNLNFLQYFNSLNRLHLRLLPNHGPHDTSSSKWDCFASYCRAIANVVDNSKTIVAPGTASSQRRNHTVGAIPHPPPLFFIPKWISCFTTTSFWSKNQIRQNHQIQSLITQNSIKTTKYQKPTTLKIQNPKNPWSKSLKITTLFNNPYFPTKPHLWDTFLGSQMKNKT